MKNDGIFFPQYDASGSVTFLYAYVNCIKDMYDTNVWWYQYCELFRCRELSLFPCAKNNTVLFVAWPLSHVKRMFFVWTGNMWHSGSWASHSHIVMCGTQETLYSVLILVLLLSVLTCWMKEVAVFRNVSWNLSWVLTTAPKKCTWYV
jgi:hypothetical protein